jgi:hypothetical protein
MQCSSLQNTSSVPNLVIRPLKRDHMNDGHLDPPELFSSIHWRNEAVPQER